MVPYILATLLAGILFSSYAQTQSAHGDDGTFTQLPLRTHSLNPPYLDSEMRSRWFDFGGSTVVRADQYIRLSGERPSQQGWIFSRVPLTATNWEIEVEFKIHGTGHLYGDGFAMWLTKQRAQVGPIFGFQDKFEGLGIFFDTYKNNRPGVTWPYVMAMMGDGNTAYSMQNDGKDNEIGGCSARGIRNSDIPTLARISYRQEQSLILELQYKAVGEWTPCFTIPNLKIPQVAYLGFSAETGELSDNHDIISVTTNNLYVSGGDAGATAPDRKNKYRQSKAAKSSPSGQEKQAGGWGWFFLKVVIFLVVCAGGYVGFTIWRSQKRRRF